MKQGLQLLVIDADTGAPLNHDDLGAGPRRVHLMFAEAAFPSIDDHRNALHREVSDHVQLLHHHMGLTPSDLHETEHKGQPAYVMVLGR